MAVKRIATFGGANPSVYGFPIERSQKMVETDAILLTDETGASQSFPIDTFTGTCSAEEGGDMGALGTLRCWWAGAGVNLIAVARGAEVIVLRQWVEEQQDEPLDYEELQRIQVTYGAKVVFQL